MSNDKMEMDGKSIELKKEEKYLLLSNILLGMEATMPPTPKRKRPEPAPERKQAEPAPEQQLAPKPRKDNPALLATLKGHTNWIVCVAISPDGKRIVSGSVDETIRVWDSGTYQQQATLIGHSNWVRGITFTPDGKRIVSSCDDHTVKVWDKDTNELLHTITAHTGPVRTAAVTPDGLRFITCSIDGTIKIWDSNTFKLLGTLEGHLRGVYNVAVAPNGKKIVSGGLDKSLIVWDSVTFQPLATLRGHTDSAYSTAFTPDGTRVVSSSYDNTLKVWDSVTYQLLATLEGHTSAVMDVAITPDGKRIVSGSKDDTIKVWDSKTYQLLATLEGHNSSVRCVAITPDGKRIVSGSFDSTIKIWDLEMALQLVGIQSQPAQQQYKSAKVVLLGDIGVGKSALAQRLRTGKYQATTSTFGAEFFRSEKLTIKPDNKKNDVEYEVWLWDFAGQSSYRILHQLFMDETALGLILFNPQDDEPFEEISHWEKSLQFSRFAPPKLLIASRCDRGDLTVSWKRVEKFIQDHGYTAFFKTDAESGKGYNELIAAITQHIPWKQLPITSTADQFYQLRETILEYAEKHPLVRFVELYDYLHSKLPKLDFDDSALRTVIGHLENAGAAKDLQYGGLILLQPSLLNCYASAAVNSANETPNDLAEVLEEKIKCADLNYPEKADWKRLPPADEKLMMSALLELLVKRGVCYRQLNQNVQLLVFPSYFRRELPQPPDLANVLMTFHFTGANEQAYSTLVTGLKYSERFTVKEHWKNATEFLTPTGKSASIQMIRHAEASAELKIYFEKAVPNDTKIVFTRFVYDHLRKEKVCNLNRERFYFCPECGTNTGTRAELDLMRLEGIEHLECRICKVKNKKSVMIPIVDEIERLFEAPETIQAVQKDNAIREFRVQTDALEQILVGHLKAIAGQAGHTFDETRTDDGIDGEIALRDDYGHTTGERIYFQLKYGDSYLKRRIKDGKLIFQIKKTHHRKLWMTQKDPVMLVIEYRDEIKACRTSEFRMEESDSRRRIEWMDIREYLQNQKTPSLSIEWQGTPLTDATLLNYRNQRLGIKEKVKLALPGKKAAQKKTK